MIWYFNRKMSDLYRRRVVWFLFFSFFLRYLNQVLYKLDKLRSLPLNSYFDEKGNMHRNFKLGSPNKIEWIWGNYIKNAKKGFEIVAQKLPRDYNMFPMHKRGPNLNHLIFACRKFCVFP